MGITNIRRHPHGNHHHRTVAVVRSEVALRRRRRAGARSRSLVGLSVSLSSDSNAPATGVTPQATQVVGSADSIDHAASRPHVTAGSADSIDHVASTEQVTPAEARRNASNERLAESGESRVPATAF